MKTLKILVNLAAIVVLALCVYASELLSEIFEGRFKIEPFAIGVMP